MSGDDKVVEFSQAQEQKAAAVRAAVATAAEDAEVDEDVRRGIRAGLDARVAALEATNADLLDRLELQAALIEALDDHGVAAQRKRAFADAAKRVRAEAATHRRAGSPAGAYVFEELAIDIERLR